MQGNDYLHGRQLIQDVRKDYEQMVSEIQSDISVCTLPLANELVTWPSPSGLCYPVFQERQCEVTHHDQGPSVATHDQSPSVATHDQNPSVATHDQSDQSPSVATHDQGPSVFQERQCESTQTTLDSMTAGLDSAAQGLVSHKFPYSLPSMEWEKWEGEKCGCLKCEVTPEKGQDLVKQNKDEENITLPRDKESLLELKTKLTMELVWLKQAIVSRQKVC